MKSPGIISIRGIIATFTTVIHYITPLLKKDLNLSNGLLCSQIAWQLWLLRRMKRKQSRKPSAAPEGGDPLHRLVILLTTCLFEAASSCLFSLNLNSEQFQSGAIRESETAFLSFPLNTSWLKSYSSMAAKTVSLLIQINKENIFHSVCNTFCIRLLSLHR